MPLSGISAPPNPPLTPPAAPSGWLPHSPSFQAPETPSTPPLPFPEEGRGGGRHLWGGVCKGHPAFFPPAPPGMQLAGLLEEAGKWGARGGG